LKGQARRNAGLVVYDGRMAPFPTTQWSLIRRAGSTTTGRTAFGELAEAYRGAIFAFFRARLDATSAEDATQSFLALSFEHAWWSRADAEAGSFRGFLLLLLRRHLGRVRASSEKETALETELTDPGPSAEQQFDARFALALTARAVEALRGDYRERDRGDLFEHLLATLGAPPEHGDLQRIATALGMPANTLTVELRRLRQRLREQLRAQLQELCADAETFAEEWSTLQRILGGAS
jgi:DNA-directed RNA polymerase specialized sigma24 family protein